MKPITFDVKYWPGVQGKQASRIVLEDASKMVTELRDVLYNPTVQGVQVTIEKNNSMEF